MTETCREHCPCCRKRRGGTWLCVPLAIAAGFAAAAVLHALPWLASVPRWALDFWAAIIAMAVIPAPCWCEWDDAR
jgi:hypothetical protein